MLEMNHLESYLNQDAIREAIERKDEIDSVSFGIDSGAGYKNDIFVSVSCNTVEGHGNSPCMCIDVLEQEKLKNVDIDIRLAENIAHYVSGLLGGKKVIRG